jgi:hypothetical protein
VVIGDRRAQCIRAVPFCPIGAAGANLLTLSAVGATAMDEERHMFESVQLADLKSASPGGWHYRAVHPDDVNEVFPVTLGVSSPASEAGTVMLVAGGGDGNVSLALHSGVNDPTRHECRGIAAGTYDFDMAVNRDGAWSGEWATTFLNGSDSGAWRPGPPPNGVYKLSFYVSPDTAEEIRIREQEHIDDFTLAWDCSIGSLQWAVGQVVGAADATAAVNQLIQILKTAELSYLIPAAPATLGSWGQRAVEVYVDLCEHSKERDRSREHSPANYQFDVADKTITVQVVLKPAMGNSAAYVLPSEIPVVYGGGPLGGEGDEAGVLPEAVIGVGDRVTWKEGTQITFRDPESDYYLDPELTGFNIGDLPAVQNALAQGVLVHSVLDPTMVVLATTIGGQDAYVKARVSVLQLA